VVRKGTEPNVQNQIMWVTHTDLVFIIRPRSTTTRTHRLVCRPSPSRILRLFPASNTRPSRTIPSFVNAPWLERHLPPRVDEPPQASMANLPRALLKMPLPKSDLNPLAPSFLTYDRVLHRQVLPPASHRIRMLLASHARHPSLRLLLNPHPHPDQRL
jgi:hypothetical protein